MVDFNLWMEWKAQPGTLGNDWEGIVMAGSVDLFSLTPRSTFTPESPAGDDQSGNTSSTQKLMGSFREVLTDKLEQVDSMHKNAHDKVRQFASGEIENVHDVSIALQKADMALNLATLFREKILTAYDELKQLQ